MEKLLSVIIPIYNVELYLDRCMESVINQTYKNLEIIMVDDGSPDTCPQKCDEWAKKDSRIKVIHKKNGGLSDARNSGIQLAKGEYIAFIDSDDFIEQNMYSVMIEAMERTDADISTCGRYVFRNGVKRERHTFNEEVVLSPNGAMEQLLRGGLIEEASWDKVYKRRLFFEIEFPVGEINEDVVIMPYIIERAERIVCTGKPFYYYCENPNSITHANYNEQKRVVIEHIKKISQYIESNYPYLKDALDEFQGRYACAFLSIFKQQPELQKKYFEDYLFFKEFSKRNVWILLKSKYRSRKEKIELACSLLGIYRLIWKTKHKLEGRG